ncbi:putative immune-type receptor 6a precursor [Silurus asotus]|uniref:Immune-type receptor 6a n=1 Tax=Silurus asotus TaxID=30991 RepID=A0AAD5AEH9_SILAS|nr:putative immune-type receptor 6a precursor [Silurus asotus]
MISLFVALYSLLCLCTAGENIFKSFISNSNITYLPHLLTSLTIKYHTLFTVKTSDMMELQVKTLKREGNVTIECNISMFKDKSKAAWYRQGFGKVPQFFARYYGQNSYKFDERLNASRFNITVSDYQFDLYINNMKEDDKGDYFCGEIEGNKLTFTLGARLQFEGKLLDSDYLLIPNQHQYYEY